MKRDEALAPLSREHHSSLILAQLLKKNAPEYWTLPTTEAGKVKYATDQFEQHIKQHFLKEEEMLQQVKDCHYSVAALADEIVAEHRTIETLFAALADAGDLTDAMDSLAIALEAHIRKEERVLFPLLQQHCSATQMAGIHALLH